MIGFLLWAQIMLSDIQKFRLFTSLGYSPGPVQEQGHFTDKRNIFILGGNRSGKSMFDTMEAASVGVCPDHNIWAVAPTYQLCDKVFSGTRKLLIKLGSPFVKDQARPPFLQTPFGTRIWGKSTDEIKSLEGESVDLEILDEIGFMNQIVWNRAVVRADKDRSRIIVSGTPKGKNSWLRRFWAEKEKDPANWLCLKMPTDEQPYVSRIFLENAERELGGKDSPAYREQIRGEFIPYGLLIFPMFGPANVAEHYPVMGEGWRFVIGVDYGFVHPCAGAFWALGPGDDCFKLAEYHKTSRTRHDAAKDLAEQAQQLQEKHKIAFSCVWCPPEERDFMSELKKTFAGLAIKTANHEVDPGVELVRRLLPEKLRFHKSCKWTFFDYENFCNKPDSDEILKLNDDHCDADRYVLASEFKRPKQLPYAQHA